MVSIIWQIQTSARIGNKVKLPGLWDYILKKSDLIQQDIPMNSDNLVTSL